MCQAFRSAITTGECVLGHQTDYHTPNRGVLTADSGNTRPRALQRASSLGQLYESPISVSTVKNSTTVLSHQIIEQPGTNQKFRHLSHTLYFQFRTKRALNFR